MKKTLRVKTHRSFAAVGFKECGRDLLIPN
jgi:hypothetical protein